MLYPISKFVRDSVDLIVGYIDASGTVKVEPRFAGGGHFCEGKASVVHVDGRSGFLNLTGVLAIPTMFRGLSEFHDGVCAIGADRGVGYIDHSGKWLIPPRFLIAMPFSEGRAFVSDDGETFRMIDAKGSSIGRDSFERARVLRAGLAPVMKNGRWGSSTATEVPPFRSPLTTFKRNTSNLDLRQQKLREGGDSLTEWVLSQ